MSGNEGGVWIEESEKGGGRERRGDEMWKLLTECIFMWYPWSFTNLPLVQPNKGKGNSFFHFPTSRLRVDFPTTKHTHLGKRFLSNL